MTATVYDFHDIPEAKAKWSDMERFHLLLAGIDRGNTEAAALARFHCLVVEPSAESSMPCDVDPFEYTAPDKDPA